MVIKLENVKVSTIIDTLKVAKHLISKEDPYADIYGVSRSEMLEIIDALVESYVVQETECDI
jgi:hypothetical protein